MQIKKLKIEKIKFDLNLKFYFFLKNIIKSKLTHIQNRKMIEIINLNKETEIVDAVENINEFLASLSMTKQEAMAHVVNIVENKVDFDLLMFGLKLCSIKDLLLQEAKLTDILDVEAMSHLDPLSLAYDKKSVYAPYATRVNGALLSLLFFSNLEAGNTNFISEDAEEFIKVLSKEVANLQKNGLEPNQIFMLMFSESMNQSIISDSGVNYEDRILSVLEKIGIPKANISKAHDAVDASTEYDFFFRLKGKTFGIGAKRTLRERYKQFIKTAVTSDIDVMIEITLGLDLNESKAKTIIGHGTILFVSDEIYNSRKFLQDLEGVYSVSDLNIETLNSLIK